MNKKMIPAKLHHLISLVEKWGIEDDGYRDEAIEKANNLELEKLVGSITEEDANELDKWFTDPFMLSKPTNEYIKYSVFFMAYEYPNAGSSLGDAEEDVGDLGQVNNKENDSKYKFYDLERMLLCLKWHK